MLVFFNCGKGEERKEGRGRGREGSGGRWKEGGRFRIGLVK